MICSVTCISFGLIGSKAHVLFEPHLEPAEFKREEHETPSAPSSEDKGEIERELAEVTFEDVQEALFDGSYFLTSSDGNVDRSKLFNSKELDKATDHFNVNRIIGQGGQEVIKGKNKEIMIVANLAKRCLNLNGKKRPSMREVAMVLEGIQASKKESNVQQNHQEVEYVRTKAIEPWDIVVRDNKNS
ncbi:hypothetical protein JRO89_XS02G0254800 [Xanthoceras sorbifolium]|uniref:Uncharacterized protein n=1 Tax=Xanthoceras sorbifolium TaxID=99658 RepID=A0ABQ8IGY6_9ROSI|nr:hypothetical protein JRO89_XS02G0254800 [Xanthoceras sorbifolium]